MKAAILCFPKVGFQTAQYPTGLYKIASHCSNEYDIFVVDQRIEKETLETLSCIIEKNDILCIGLSVMTCEQIKYALEISRYFHKKIKIVWGGMHPTVCPKETISSEFIDHLIIGEGENAFLNLLHYYEKKKIEEELFLSKTNLNFKYNYIENLNSCNYVNFNKYPIKEIYFTKRDGFEKAFNIETSRGCPHSCHFCHNSICNKSYRYLSSEKVISLLDFLYTRHGIDGIIFQEDNFFLNRDRVSKILDYLVSNKIGWKANCRIDYFNSFKRNQIFMKKLVDSKCQVLQFGIESGSEKILKMINKRIRLNDVIDVNRFLADYPIKLRFNFMVGFPNETIDDINKTLDLAKRLGEDNANVEPPFLNIYNPYPGTQLYSVAVSCGFIAPRKLEDWASFSWNTPVSNWLAPKVRRYIEKLSIEFLSRTNYIK